MKQSTRLRLTGLIILLLLARTTVSEAQQPEPVKKPGKDWVYLENGNLRVGLLRSHGGAIAHLSERNAKLNVLNHYDHGRLVQQSYYGDEDGSRWGDKPWRYNPVQGGDYQGHPAKVLEFTSNKTTAYSKTTPRHWATGELLEDCTMEQWVELEGPIVKVRFRFQYDGSRTHQPRHQETPAVFVAPRLATLVTYSGDKPWTDAALSRKRPGWPNEHVIMSESWAAYLADDGIGVGVYVPGVLEATSYRFQGGKGSDCSYIAPLKTFALKTGMTHTYQAYLTLGDAATIRGHFKSLHSQAE